MAKKIRLEVSLEVYDTGDLDEVSKKLLMKARQACQSAYCPYSGFQVGAALLLENGKAITGSNQENAAYPAGLCAERVAVFAASARYPKVKIQKIAIAAKRSNSKHFIYATPCGSCRQVMSEYENLFGSPIQIIMQGEKEKIFVANTVDMLLPFKFSDKTLGTP